MQHKTETRTQIERMLNSSIRARSHRRGVAQRDLGHKERQRLSREGSGSARQRQRLSREGSGSARQRHCLSHEPNVGIQGNGSVLAAEAVETREAKAVSYESLLPRPAALDGVQHQLDLR